MNIAIKKTEKSYSFFMFRDALKSGFYDLQLARDEYRLSCGAAGMNRDLLWRFMDVQTRLITPICPHYAEHVWRKIWKKEGFAIKAGWPVADTSDPTLRIANKYLQDSIVSMRKLLQKQESGSKKPKKGVASAPLSEANKMSVGLIYVNEHYSGWKEQCLRVLQSKFDSQTRSFPPDQEITEALMNCSLGEEMNLKHELEASSEAVHALHQVQEGRGEGGRPAGAGFEARVQRDGCAAGELGADQEAAGP